MLPAILSLFGAILAIFIYHILPEFVINLTETSLGKKIYTFLNSKYYFDIIYNHYIISGGLQLSYNISKILDRGVIELIGPYGLSNSLTNTGKNIAKLDTGIITTYGLYIILGLIILVFIIFNEVVIKNNFIDSRLIIILLFALFIVTSNFTKYNYNIK